MGQRRAAREYERARGKSDSRVEDRGLRSECIVSFLTWSAWQVGRHSPFVAQR